MRRWTRWMVTGLCLLCLLAGCSQAGKDKQSSDVNAGNESAGSETTGGESTGSESTDSESAVEGLRYDIPEDICPLRAESIERLPDGRYVLSGTKFYPDIRLTDAQKEQLERSGEMTGYLKDAKLFSVAAAEQIEGQMVYLLQWGDEEWRAVLSESDTVAEEREGFRLVCRDGWELTEWNTASESCGFGFRKVWEEKVAITVPADQLIAASAANEKYWTAEFLYELYTAFGERWDARLNPYLDLMISGQDGGYEIALSCAPKSAESYQVSLPVSPDRMESVGSENGEVPEVFRYNLPEALYNMDIYTVEGQADGQYVLTGTKRYSGICLSEEQKEELERTGRMDIYAEGELLWRVRWLEGENYLFQWEEGSVPKVTYVHPVQYTSDEDREGFRLGANRGWVLTTSSDYTTTFLPVIEYDNFVWEEEFTLTVPKDQKIAMVSTYVTAEFLYEMYMGYGCGWRADGGRQAENPGAIRLKVAETENGYEMLFRYLP